MSIKQTSSQPMHGVTGKKEAVRFQERCRKLSTKSDGFWICRIWNGLFWICRTGQRRNMQHKVTGTFEDGTIISHTDPTEAYRLITECDKKLTVFEAGGLRLDLDEGRITFDDCYIPELFLEEPNRRIENKQLVYYRTMEQVDDNEPVMVSYTIGYEGISNGNLVRRTITMENLDV